jgi:thiol-disulfide isomerase/thioredoxin
MYRRTCLLALTAIIVLPLGAAPSASASKPAKPLHIAKGERVTITDFVVPGKTTIFDFYSDYCGPCVQVAPALEKLHRTRDDVVVVKVDINRPGQRGIDWKSPVAQQYRLESIPHFRVYGPDGKLIAQDRPGNSKAREIVMGLLK